MNDIPDLKPGLEQRLFAKASANRLPIYGNLELTPLCNMNCDMCFVRLSPSELKTLGRLRTVDEYVRLAEEMRQVGVLFLQLTGGEPLTYPGFRELYLHLERIGMIVTVNTNATLLDDEWADFLGAHPPRRINVTLYGTNNEVYHSLCHLDNGFDKVRAGIRRLKERGVMVKLNYSLTRKNSGQMLQEAFEIADDLEVPIVVDSYMLPAVRERSRNFAHDIRVTPEEMARVDELITRKNLPDVVYREHCRKRLELVEKHKNELAGLERKPMTMNCNGGICAFVVNWQGMLRPCIMLGTPSVDVFETGFEAAWNIISKASSCVTFSPSCSVCYLKSICKVCAASSILETGNEQEKPEYICESTREQYRLLEEVVKKD